VVVTQEAYLPFEDPPALDYAASLSSNATLPTYAIIDAGLGKGLAFRVGEGWDSSSSWREEEKTKAWSCFELQAPADAVLGSFNPDDIQPLREVLLSTFAQRVLAWRLQQAGLRLSFNGAMNNTNAYSSKTLLNRIAQSDALTISVSFQETNPDPASEVNYLQDITLEQVGHVGFSEADIGSAVSIINDGSLRWVEQRKHVFARQLTWLNDCGPKPSSAEEATTVKSVDPVVGGVVTLSNGKAFKNPQATFGKLTCCTEPFESFQ
jgi:hypothetical protein